MNAPLPLPERYERALLARQRVRDAAQAAVVRRLAQLSDCLDGAHATGLRRWFRLPSRFPRYPRCCRGIYLWGGVGRGKTWLMDLFQQQRADTRRLHFQHLMREVHSRLAKLRRRRAPLRLVAAAMAAEARVWCIDEFEVLDIADAMMLHGLVEALLAQGVVLVMTSNTPPAQLYRGGLQRARFLPAIALLERELDVIELAPGQDYRQFQLQAVDTWLPAFSAASTAQMRVLFERLAGSSGIDRAPTMLIEDRPIATLCHAGGMAWFSFAALCEGPRSAADYIAIARQLHTVFLSDVPVFDGGNDDAARRFIALIDELYDRRVRLVISAAAEPAGLYRGERLRAQFERTASRLVEMRGRTATPASG